MILQDAVDRFLAYVRDQKNYSANTVKAYRTDLADFFAFLECKSQGKDARGERVKIRVENIDSKKSIYAQVVDAKTVKIDF